MSGADHGPIEEKQREFMNALARGIDDLLNGKDCPKEKKKTGFTLLVYDFETGPDGGRFNYISNSDRQDVIATMKEVIARHEGRYHEKGGVQ
jgi:hypothetical protein